MFVAVGDPFPGLIILRMRPSLRRAAALMELWTDGGLVFENPHRSSVCLRGLMMMKVDAA